MKKLLFLLLLFGLILPTAVVVGETFEFDAGGGLYYNAVTVPEGVAGLLASLFNLRGGVHINGRYLIAENTSAGLELGLVYISSDLTLNGVETSWNLFDLPVYGFYEYNLGGISFMPFGGLLFLGSTSSSSDAS